MRNQLTLTLDHLRSLWAFLKAPVVLHAEKGASFRTILIFCSIGLIPALIAGGAMRSLVEAGILPDPGHHAIAQMPPLILLAGAVVLAPLLEELVFRTQLRSFSWNLVFTLFIAGVIINHFLPSGSPAVWISPLTLTGICWLARTWSGKSVSRKFRVWRYLFPVNFYLTALTFSYVHLVNFSRAESLLYIGLLYTVPQLILGLVLGYVRIRYDLGRAILLHALFNGTILLMSFAEDLISKV